MLFLNFSNTIYFLIVASAHCLLMNNVYAAELYKYRDAEGKLHFVDKKPEHIDAESIAYKVDHKTVLEPTVRTQINKNQSEIVVENPLYGPIELSIQSPQLSASQRHFVIPPQTIRQIFKTTDEIVPYKYAWQLGDPNAKPQPQIYDLPVASTTCHNISQGFNGRFSHNNIVNQYAVDIALPVGTPILAAREGTVVSTKDDYYMGGVNDYFIDKANYIEVVHSDGTFAIYAHIVLGSAVVKPGDKVKTGTVLAMSGSSGFSSGPHLHFAIFKNMGMHMESIMFNFIDNKGNHFVPVKGKTICNF